MRADSERPVRERTEWWILVVALTTGCAAGPSHAARPAVLDAWSARTIEQKFDVMQHVVQPEMGRLFQKFYNEPDVKLSCKSCHGDNGEQIGWRMPNDLPKLDPKHMPDRNEEEAKFMYEQVTPTMQRLLGVGAYEEKQGTGLGCFSCHPMKGKS